MTLLVVRGRELSFPRSLLPDGPLGIRERGKPNRCPPPVDALRIGNRPRAHPAVAIPIELGAVPLGASFIKRDPVFEQGRICGRNVPTSSRELEQTEAAPQQLRGTDGMLAHAPCRLRAILADHPDLPVIYTSGYAAEAVGGDLQFIEGENFIQKPYSPQRLADLVRRTLDSRTRP